MSCVKPLKGFPVGLTKNGKVDYKICSYDIDHIELQGDNWLKCKDNHISDNAKKVVKEYIEIPCGTCLGCRLQYSHDWSIRCMLEMQEHKENCFVTLTYDDKNVPKSFVQKVDELTGEVSYVREGQNYSLDKKDLQTFIRHLRQRGYKCRYYSCSEYGDTTLRPHYHLILFGYCPKDLKFYKKSKNGDNHYHSQELQEIWNKGEVIVGEATFESCAYVARYVMKKVSGKNKEFYELNGLEPEQVFMSRRPGIANNYYQAHKDTDLFLNEHFFVPSKNGSKSCTPFRYFKKCYEQDYPGDLKRLQKLNEKFNKSHKLNALKLSDKMYQDILKDKELILNSKSNQKRKEI